MLPAFFVEEGGVLLCGAALLRLFRLVRTRHPRSVWEAGIGDMKKVRRYDIKLLAIGRAKVAVHP